MVVLTIQKAGLIYKPELLAITLSLVVLLGLLLQSLDLPSSLPAILSSSFINNAFADHGQEIVLSLNDSSFAPSSTGEGNQARVVVNYATRDPMAVHDLAKGVMKVYTPNGTLLKTSSSPTPFPISASGKLQLATTLTADSIETVTANIVFTNPIRTETISNELPVKLDLDRGINSASLEENQETADVLQEEQQTTSTPTTSVGGQETQQPSVIPPNLAEADEIIGQQPPPPPQPQEIVPPEQSSAPIAPMEPLFQGTPASAAETTTSSPVEICTDGIDNDADALTDFEDNNCPVVGSTLESMQQEQLASSTLEICDDTLDNDLDGKIDAADEECLSTTPATQVAPQVQDSQNGSEEEQQSTGGEEYNDNDNKDENDEDNDEDDDDENEDNDDNN